MVKSVIANFNCKKNMQFSSLASQTLLLSGQKQKGLLHNSFTVILNIVAITDREVGGQHSK